MHASTLLATTLLAGAASAQQPPIRIFFDIHADPIANGLPPAGKLAEYAERVELLTWALDQVEPYGVQISFLSAGAFMELLVGGGPAGDGAAQLRRVYAMGGQIGSHSHREHYAGPLDWPDYDPDAPLPESTDSWQDNVDWVDQAILTAFSGAPPEPLADINCVKGAGLPADGMDFHTLMAAFGFELRQPGPEEDYFAYYGHHIWNPFRPATWSDMAEDLSGPFVALTAGPVIGRDQIHHGIHQDMTMPAVKRQLLQLYVNWRHRDRHGLPEKIWTWGWSAHPADLVPGGEERAALVDVVEWLDAHFAHHVEPSGSQAMMWSTHREAAAAYFAWETAHPGVSSFSFDSLSVDWSEYPYLRPVAEELYEFGWQADLSLGPGVRAFLLARGADQAVLMWRELGSSLVDLTALLDADARVVGMETGIHYSLNDGAILVGAEPLLVTELDRCPEPVNHCASTPNSTGLPARLEALGSTSLSAGSFALRASQCPAHVPAVLFAGPRVQEVPFRDGFLCLGGPLVRLGPARGTGPAGEALFPLHLLGAGGPIGAGQAWNFQVLYRDLAAGSSGANLTDAVNALLCP